MGFGKASFQLRIADCGVRGVCMMVLRDNNDVQNLATEFPITQTSAYLNTAAQGPWPARTVQAVQRAAEHAQYLEFDRAHGEPAIFLETRTRLAKLLNVQPDDLVFGPNTTYGLNVCVHGIDWRAGDNLVVPHNEFPSVQYALAHLQKLGVDVRSAAWQGSGPTVDQIMARVDARTRAVICSAIAWDTGYRMDLETLGARCEAAGCLLIVDGIHAVGAECLDLAALRVSALSFHGYKWLMAGFGAGVLYVAPSAVDRIGPSFIGPQGVMGNQMAVQADLPWKPGAQRYSAGTGNQIGATALNASLTLIEGIGIAHISTHNHELASLLADGLKRCLPDARLLRSSEPKHQSAIVVFTTGNSHRDAALVDHLGANGVVVALRPAGIRVAPHLFNTAQDIEKLLGCVETWRM